MLMSDLLYIDYEHYNAFGEENDNYLVSDVKQCVNVSSLTRLASTLETS